MKAVVDEDTCIACGLCVGTCETVFAFNDNGKAYSQVDVIPAIVPSKSIYLLKSSMLLFKIPCIYAIVMP